MGVSSNPAAKDLLEGPEGATLVGAGGLQFCILKKSQGSDWNSTEVVILAPGESRRMVEKLVLTDEQMDDAQTATLSIDGCAGALTVNQDLPLDEAVREAVLWQAVTGLRLAHTLNPGYRAGILAQHAETLQDLVEGGQ